MPVSDVSLELTNMLNALNADIASKKDKTQGLADFAFNPYGDAGTPEAQIQGLLEEDTPTPIVAPPVPQAETAPVTEGLIEPTPVVAPKETPKPVSIPTPQEAIKVPSATEAKKEAETAVKEKSEPKATESTYGPSKKVEDFKSTEDYLKNANSETALVAGQLYQDMKKLDPEMAEKTLAILKDYGSFTGYADIKKARTEYAKTLEAYPKEMEELSKQADTLRAKRPEYNWFLLAAAAIAGGKGGAAFINSYYKAVNDRFATDKEREAGSLADRIKALEYKVQAKGTLLKLTTDQMADDVSMIKFLGGQYVRAKDALLLAKTNAISEVFLQESQQSVNTLKVFTDSELKNIFTTKYGVTPAQLPTVLEAYYAYREQHKGVDVITNEVAQARAFERNKALKRYDVQMNLYQARELAKLQNELNNNNNVGGDNSLISDTLLKDANILPEPYNETSTSNELMTLNDKLNKLRGKYGDDIFKKLAPLLADPISLLRKSEQEVLEYFEKADILGTNTVGAYRATTARGRDASSGGNRPLELKYAALTPLVRDVRTTLQAVKDSATFRPKLVANALNNSLSAVNERITNQLSSSGLIEKDMSDITKAKLGGFVVNAIKRTRVESPKELIAAYLILTDKANSEAIIKANANTKDAEEQLKGQYESSIVLLDRIKKDPQQWNAYLDKASIITGGSGAKGKVVKGDIMSNITNDFSILRGFINNRNSFEHNLLTKVQSALNPNSELIDGRSVIYTVGYGLGFNEGLMYGEKHDLRYLTFPLSAYITEPHK